MGKTCVWRVKQGSRRRLCQACIEAKAGCRVAGQDGAEEPAAKKARTKKAKSADVTEKVPEPGPSTANKASPEKGKAKAVEGAESESGESEGEQGSLESVVSELELLRDEFCELRDELTRRENRHRAEVERAERRAETQEEILRALLALTQVQTAAIVNGCEECEWREGPPSETGSDSDASAELTDFEGEVGELIAEFTGIGDMYGMRKLAGYLENDGQSAEEEEEEE